MLSSEEIAVYEQRLKRAEDAYDDLMIGEAAVEIRDSNGEMTRYSQTNSGRLLAYINRLRRALGKPPMPGTETAAPLYGRFT